MSDSPVQFRHFTQYHIRGNLLGKLAQLLAVKSAKVESFVYIPPDAAFGAARILVKPAMAYPIMPPATVSMTVLLAVLRGLRRASPMARIVVIEGSSSAENVLNIFEKNELPLKLDDEMRAGDAETLIMTEYPNRLRQPMKYSQMTAPEYLADYDCVISLGAFKKTIHQGSPRIDASLANLTGFFPRDIYAADDPHTRGQFETPSRDDVLKDIYFTIGHHIDGAVVDLGKKYVSPDERYDHVKGVSETVGQVVWGDDLLAVDETACRLAGEDAPAYLNEIRQLKKVVDTL